MISSLSHRESSPFATLRSQAMGVIRGPRNILWESDTPGDAPLFGWQVLRLEGREKPPVDRIESRSVYTHLYDPMTNTAILRAISWHGSAVRQAMKTANDAYQLVLPVRFVQIPLAVVQTWLAAFQDLTVNLADPTEPDALIKTLRISLDYASCVAEKTWQNQHRTDVPLHEAWRTVWHSMSDKLSASPFQGAIDEQFAVGQPHMPYASDAYQGLYDSIPQ